MQESDEKDRLNTMKQALKRNFNPKTSGTTDDDDEAMLEGDVPDTSSSSLQISSPTPLQGRKKRSLNDQKGPTPSH